jgi:hypothetical protein
MAMMSPVPKRCVRALLAASFLLAACTPSPEAVRAGARRWDPEATKSPPPSDADEGTDDPPGPIEADAEAEPIEDAGTGTAIDVRRPLAGLDGPTRETTPPPPPTEGPLSPCALTFQVTTVTANGTYAPRNVGAIWVSDANAGFVKSLYVWAGKRLRHLTAWNAASAGDRVDAVTGATINSHGTRMAKWDCTDVDHQPVAGGNYRINVEFTERNGAGKLMAPLEFPRNGEAVNLMPPDQGNFKNIRLQVSP